MTAIASAALVEMAMAFNIYMFIYVFMYIYHLSSVHQDWSPVIAILLGSSVHSEFRYLSCSITALIIWSEYHLHSQIVWSLPTFWYQWLGILLLCDTGLLWFWHGAAVVLWSQVGSTGERQRQYLRQTQRSRSHATLYTRWDLKSMHGVAPRRYLLQNVALEVFSTDGRNYMFALMDTQQR